MKKTTVFCFIASSVIVSGCAPMIMGSGAAIGVAATREKGITGAMSDTKISSAIKLGLYQKDPDLHRLVDVNVQNGEVLLTGAVPTEEMHLDAVKIAWKPYGVTRVIDNIGKSDGATFGVYAGDTWITTQLKSSLMFDGEIQSRNYSIKTVSGQVYLMGIAQDQAELDKVVNHAKNTNGVIKVVSYVQVKDGELKDDERKDEGAKEDGEPKSATIRNSGWKDDEGNVPEIRDDKGDTEVGDAEAA